MLTLKEYELLSVSWQLRAVYDGWRPLCVHYREADQKVVLIALVNTEAPEEPEVFRVLSPGDDLAAIQEREKVELAFLGLVRVGPFASECLFLDVKPASDETNRRQGRLDLENFLKKGVDKSR